MTYKIIKKNVQYKQVMDLLLLADPSKEMVLGYLKESESYLAYQGDNIVGILLTLERSTHCLEIMNLAVKESHQAKGIGRALLEYLIDSMDPNKVKELLIATANSSLHQLRLYQSLGFHVIHVDHGFFLREYDEDIYENGMRCEDKITLSLKLE